MFLGEYSHSLDPKGRLTIPARFRTELESGLVIARGQETCLTVYPQAVWQEMSENLARLPRTHGTVRSYSRLMFSGAHEATLDKMGRVLIPAFLREYAGIDQQATVVGVNTVLEIWNPEAWQATYENECEERETITAAIADMGV